MLSFILIFAVFCAANEITLRVQNEFCDDQSLENSERCTGLCLIDLTGRVSDLYCQTFKYLCTCLTHKNFR